MYGVVNQAIEGMVLENFGTEIWEKIKEKSQLMEVEFLNNEPYPDKITYDLVLAANEVTQIPVPDILQGFGEYWILNTGLKKYGSLMKSGGDNFKDFIVNLPNFHSRVMLMYPKLTPPSFIVDNIQDNSLELSYFSDRPGLKDFVIGLLRGLGKMFDTHVHIELLQERDKGASHEIFKVSF